MFNNLPEWARPAATVGIILGAVGAGLLCVAVFLAVNVPQVLQGTGDVPVLVLMAAGGLALVSALICAMILYLQGVRRGKWQ